MIFSRSLLLITAALIAGSLCHAGTYVKVAGLYSQPGDLNVSGASAFAASLKNNTGVSGSLGYKFPLFRLEAELQRVSNSTEADEVSGTLFGGNRRTVGSVKQTSGFANAYWDLPSVFGLGPYVAAGLGYARFDIDELTRTRDNVPFAQFSGRDSVFGYQGMLGLQFRLFGQVTVNAGYRLVKHEDLNVRDVIANAGETLKLGTNRMFELGVAIGF